MKYVCAQCQKQTGTVYDTATGPVCGTCFDKVREKEECDSCSA